MRSQRYGPQAHRATHHVHGQCLGAWHPGSEWEMKFAGCGCELVNRSIFGRSLTSLCFAFPHHLSTYISLKVLRDRQNRGGQVLSRSTCDGTGGLHPAAAHSINTSVLELSISATNPDFRLNDLLSALQNVSMPHNQS